ncbi:MAG: amidohydrolase family protein [Armatimonadetes bacterium]|nr:amidohydrolase family protein [Armatimonadota bacterium]
MLTHVLETRTQVVTGREFYGTIIVAHLRDLGILSPRLTIAHAVWVTDGDIDLLAAHGTSVAHNPVSNLKLGRRAAWPLPSGLPGSCATWRHPEAGLRHDPSPRFGIPPPLRPSLPMDNLWRSSALCAETFHFAGKSAGT